jgi:hypothetical protein
MAGEKCREIVRITGLSRAFFYKLLRRVASTHADGRIYGLRALIPWSRPHASTLGYQQAPGDTSWSGPGAFKALLNRHPELDRFIRNRVFKRPGSRKIHESRQRIIDLHAEFLGECRKLGLNPRLDYPFTGKKSGYAALARYVKTILSESSARAIFIKYGDSGLKKMRIGDGSQRPIHFPYERVECDAHHIDALFCILLTGTEGQVFPMVIPRLWVLSIKEVVSRANLGYYLSLNKECKEEDLLRCIQHALSPWTPRDLAGTRMCYAPGAGFPSKIGEEFQGVCWDEFSVDGAKINLSERVKARMEHFVGAKVILLRRRVPDDRPFVERFFGILEEQGFHRLPNTTGSSSGDIRRNAPEVAACKYFIQLEDLENLLDILMANYNAEVHSSLGGRTPLEYLEWSQQRCQDFRPLRHVSPEFVKRIGSIRATVRVLGGHGRRPYINYQNATYSCPAFSRAYHLVGKRLTIEADDDARIVFAYLPDGQELGPLTAGAPWSRDPHTFAMRKLMVARIRDRKWGREELSDPVVSLLQDLEDRARSSGKITSDYLELRRYLLGKREAFKALADDEFRAPIEDMDNMPAHVLQPRYETQEAMPAPRMARQKESR